MSLPLLKPLLLTVGATALVFFSGVIALTVQSPAADNVQAATTDVNQSPELTSSSALFKAVTHPLSQSAKPSSLAALTAEQATVLAKQQAPNALLQATPELVNYNGSAAYEVILDKGVTYIDANSGSVLNPIASNQSHTFDNGNNGYEANYDDGYDNDDGTHDETHHKGDDDESNNKRDHHHSKNHDDDKHDRAQGSLIMTSYRVQDKEDDDD